MSDQIDRETIGDDLGVWSVDAEDQLQPEDTLDGEGDVLDRGYRVSDGYRGSLAHGITAREQSQEETIAQRLRQEEPDPWSDFVSSDDDGSGDPDDPDLDRYDGHHRVGRLVEPDEGRFEDRESRMVAREGRATSWDSPEESAMHFVDGEEEDDLAEIEWQPGDEVGSEEE